MPSLGKDLTYLAKKYLVALRSLLKEADYTQEELTHRVGISLETVSAIENNKPETMDNIGFNVVNKWWFICCQTSSEQTRESFFYTVIDFFGFSLS
jgi:HTH-type transcriptional regulator/antitoxin HipB